MVKKIVPVIIAGGKGTRLWPLSRADAPKQFIDLTGENTLFQNTLKRASSDPLFEAPIVITNEDFRFLVAEQARALGISLASVVLEPASRNTAAAIAAAAAVAAPIFGDDSILYVLPSDHKIDVDEAYFEAVRAAHEAAAQGMLVTFGIQPTEPATGFGYIEAGDMVNSSVSHVRRFVEKPDQDAALKMINAGGFYWNSGIFMFPLKELRDELAKFCPDVLEAAEAAVASSTRDLDFVRLSGAEFSRAPDISIDYALMEKTGNAAVVPSSFSWSDLGSWDAVWRNDKGDAAGNVSTHNTTLLETKNSLVISHGPHIAVHGLEGVAIIASEDAIYVGDRSSSQDVGNLVKVLSANAATSKLTESHPTCYRPWGGYTSILTGERFQVKRIFVTPGMKLSLQKHHHRSEHWVVVKGTAEVTVGDKVEILRENESVYIPLGEIHRLANPGKITLEVIEVQSGSYLGEDDIVRISDEFGRP